MENKNYLLFMLSLLSERNTEVFYKGPESTEVFSGIQTNEAATKYVIDLLNNNKQSLEKIILLCTKEVLEQRFVKFDNLTTCEYYKKKILLYLSSRGLTAADDLFEVIEYSPNENDDIDEILTPIEKLVQITAVNSTCEKHLYIDFTSGMRNSALAVLFSARILQNDGMKIEKILYSNLLRGIGETRENPAKIEECTKTYDIFEYLAGHIEAKSGMGAKRLEEYHKKYPKVQMTGLFRQVEEIGKKIKTGQTGDIQTVSDRGKNEREREIEESKASGSYMIKKTTDFLTRETNYSDMTPDAVKIDILKKYLEKKDFANAYNYIREHAVEILIDRGIITNAEAKTLIPEHITNELIANYLYYKKSYLAFAKNAMLELGSDITSKPTDLLNKLLDIPLSNFTETKANVNLSINDFINREFNYNCKRDIEILKNTMANNIRERMLNGSSDIAEQIIDEVSKYNENIEKIKKLYLTLGFPFPNIYVNRLYKGYDRIYKKAIYKSFQALDLLYGNDSSTKGNYILQKVLRRMGKEALSYSEFIGEVSADDGLLEALFPISYNDFNMQSKRYKPWELSEFLQEFMPVFYNIKNTRNIVIHRSTQSADEIISKTKEIEELVRIISK